MRSAGEVVRQVPQPLHANASRAGAVVDQTSSFAARGATARDRTGQVTGWVGSAMTLPGLKR